MPCQCSELQCRGDMWKHACRLLLTTICQTFYFMSESQASRTLLEFRKNSFQNLLAENVIRFSFDSTLTLALALALALAFASTLALPLALPLGDRVWPNLLDFWRFRGFCIFFVDFHLFRASWNNFVQFWSFLGHFWSLLDRFWNSLGRSWEPISKLHLWTNFTKPLLRNPWPSELLNSFPRTASDSCHSFGHVGGRTNF